MQFRRGCRLWWLALLAAGIDRICKAIALRGLGGGAVTAIEGALSWSLVKNTGAAFGILSGSCLLPLLTFALAAGLLFWLLRHGEAPLLLRAGLWMIAPSAKQAEQVNIRAAASSRETIFFIIVASHKRMTNSFAVSLNITAFSAQCQEV